MTKFKILFLCLTALSAFSISAKDMEVRVPNTKAGIELAGTLALPDIKVPSTFLVLASGSGAQNRDEEVMGHKPFKVISERLEGAGYGVLRLDDRGVGESEGVFETATIEDFTDDAVSAINYIRALYPDAKIGVLGHSQGGQVAVKAAAQGEADFIITLAGPAWVGDSLVMSQARALSMAAQGSWPGETLERKLLDIAKSDINELTAKTMLYMSVCESVGQLATLPEVQSQISKQIDTLLLPPYRYLLRYNPANDIRAVAVPWLALNGDKDLQVLVENLTTIKELNPAAKTVVMKGHNHLFQNDAVLGLPNEYYKGGQSPSEETMQQILGFIEAAW